LRTGIQKKNPFMSVDKAILPIKINELVQLISRKKKMDMIDAIGYLYGSGFIKRLTNPEAKWWYMSGINLYRELEKEKKAVFKETENPANKQLFIVFCTENYRASRKLGGPEVHSLFQMYSVYGFLSQHYEILHTQGEEYILEEIEQYIKNHH
jgi:hypothetical protein